MHRLTILAAVAFAACGAPSGRPSTGSESNWLSACDGDDDCRGGAGCHCGVCTLPCSSDASCVAAGAPPRCAAPDSAATTSERCDRPRAVPGICLPAGGATPEPTPAAALPRLRLDEEPPGEHCAAGGTAIHTGLDVDGDGELEESEVTDTAWVCHAGPAAEPPLAVVRVDPEPPGERCAAGGAAVHAGIDRDGDGALDDEEITSTTHVCDGRSALDELGVLEGSFTIRNGVDVALLSMFSGLTGDLVVDAPGLTRLELPRLATVGGTVDFGSAPLQSIELPALRSAGAIALLNRETLMRLDLSALEEVRGDLSVVALAVTEPLALARLGVVGGTFHLGLPALRDLDCCAALRSVGGRVELDVRNAAPSPVLLLREAGELRLHVRAFEMPELERAGALSVHASGRLSFPRLRTCEGELHLGDYPDGPLESLEVPVLERAGRIGFEHGFRGGLAVAAPSLIETSQVVLTDAPGVTAVSMPRLQSLETGFTCERCGVRALDLSALRSAGSIELKDLPLEALSLPALTEIGTELSVEGASLVSVDLRALTDVSDVHPATIRAGGQLTRLELPRLASCLALRVGGFTPDGVLALPSFTCPLHIRIAGFPPRIEAPVPLSSVDAALDPAVTRWSIAGPAEMLSILIDGPGLRELSLTGVERLTGSLALHGERFERVDAPALASVEWLQIESPQTPRCVFEPLLAQVTVTQRPTVVLCEAECPGCP